MFRAWGLGFGVWGLGFEPCGPWLPGQEHVEIGDQSGPSPPHRASAPPLPDEFTVPHLELRLYWIGASGLGVGAFGSGSASVGLHRLFVQGLHQRVHRPNYKP